MKVKKIGKILTVGVGVNMFWGVLMGAIPHVDLSITDMNGTPLTAVTLGVPFRAHVAMRNIDDKFSTPDIEGINNFARGAMSSSSQYSMTNGKTSTERVFSYVLRADKPGVFTLGPARIYNNSATMESNRIKLEVASADNSNSSEVKGQPAFLKLEVDKKKVVVGEPIWVTITLLHEPNARLHTPLMFDLEREGFVMGQQLSPRTQQVVVNGKNYISIEQKIEIYSYTSGAHTIPSVSAQCKMPVKRNRNHPQFDFDDFFGRRFELYQVYSTPSAVEVLPLPSSEKSTDIVGEFSSFTAHLEQKRAKAGEGVVLRLALHGSGNAKKVPFPVLNVPDGLTAYESKFDLEEYDGRWKKTFEYIVQGNAKGKYEIPSQQFTYFDIRKRDYNTLYTQSMPLTITEGVQTSRASQAKNVASSLPRDESSEDHKEVEKLPLLTESAGMFDSIPILPMRYFYQLRFLLILLALGLPRLLGWYKGSPQKRACRKARSRLARYQRSGEVAKLYQLMLNLLAEHAQSDVTMNEQGAFVYLQNKVADEKVADAWLRDLNRLAEASFTAGTIEDKEQLFKITDHWITELEKLS